MLCVFPDSTHHKVPYRSLDCPEKDCDCSEKSVNRKRDSLEVSWLTSSDLSPQSSLSFSFCRGIRLFGFSHSIQNHYPSNRPVSSASSGTKNHASLSLTEHSIGILVIPTPSLVLETRQSPLSCFTHSRDTSAPTQQQQTWSMPLGGETQLRSTHSCACTLTGMSRF